MTQHKKEQKNGWGALLLSITKIFFVSWEVVRMLLLFFFAFVSVFIGGKKD